MSDTPETENSPEPNPSEAPTTETTPEPSALSGKPEPTPFDIEQLKLPEEVELADEDKTFLNEFAQKHSMSQEAMNEMLETYYARLIEARDTVSEQIGRAWEENNQQWLGELHKQYGGAEKAKEVADRLAPIIDRLGGDDLRQALTITGAGNHPVVFKAFEKVANLLGEATPVNGSGTSEQKNPLANMYPTMFQE